LAVNLTTTLYHTFKAVKPVPPQGRKGRTSVRRATLLPGLKDRGIRYAQVFFYEAGSCKWDAISAKVGAKIGADHGLWVTSCGQSFEFKGGGPSYNGFEVCPYCGRELIDLLSHDGAGYAPDDPAPVTATFALHAADPNRADDTEATYTDYYRPAVVWGGTMEPTNEQPNVAQRQIETLLLELEKARAEVATLYTTLAHLVNAADSYINAQTGAGGGGPAQSTALKRALQRAWEEVRKKRA